MRSWWRSSSGCREWARPFDRAGGRGGGAGGDFCGVLRGEIGDWPGTREVDPGKRQFRLDEAGVRPNRRRALAR